MDKITRTLFEIKDEKYKSFQSKLIPTVEKSTVIGVRVPHLRKIAKELLKSGEHHDFISKLPHRYYEENLLHSLILCEIADFEECLHHTEAFLPFVDNWAVCDSLRPKCFKNHKSELLEHIKGYLHSSHSYTVRFGIEMQMVHFLDENFNPDFLKTVSEIKSDDYYVNMMIAWYFATALSKQYETTIQYIEKKTLDLWVHNKTIQKAVESYRIDSKTKEYLKTLKEKH